jgi:hypothetical protein
MKHLTLASVAALALLPAGPSAAATGENSFTPTSFVMPIQTILLAKARVGTGYDNGVAVYECNPGTPPVVSNGDAGPPQVDAGAGGDCMVDMADEAQLASLFAAPTAITPGTYDSIVVNTCFDEGSFVAKVKGSVELEGTTYYTAGSPVISTNSADLAYTDITYDGCASTVKISPPVTITAGASITVSAFFTLQNLSWVLENSSPGLGGCAVVPGGEPNVCSGLPVLVGYIGVGVPTLESYFISEDPDDLLATKAAGQVMLLSNGGEPFAGFLRRVYSHDSETPSVSYDVPLREISKNPPGLGDAGAPDASSSDGGVADSYDIQSIGDPAQDETKYRVRFPRFELQSHSGTLYTADGASSVEYRAVKR